MLRNKIPLCAFIGMLAIIFGLFFLIVGLLIVIQTGENVDTLELAVISTPSLTGGALLLSGIGLLKRKNWARKVINSILFIFLLMVSVVLYFFIQEMLDRAYWRNLPEQIGVILFAYSVLASLFLFVNNTRVIDELNQEH